MRIRHIPIGKYQFTFCTGAIDSNGTDIDQPPNTGAPRTMGKPHGPRRVDAAELCQWIMRLVTHDVNPRRQVNDDIAPRQRLLPRSITIHLTNGHVFNPVRQGAWHAGDTANRQATPQGFGAQSSPDKPIGPGYSNDSSHGYFHPIKAKA
jgi:hypothetical protein